MANNSKFKPGKSGSPATQFKPGNRFRWQPGQSGNPAGIARKRLLFEEKFFDCLIEQGSPEEAAALLWQYARDGEPWAIQALLQRLAPETKQIKVTQGIDDEPAIDLSTLRGADLDELERMLQRAGSALEPDPNGEGSPQS
jgi:hypothetical protein